MLMCITGVMLQREIPEAINLQVAKVAAAAAVLVYMDVGGEDSDMDQALFPYLHFLVSYTLIVVSCVSALHHYQHLSPSINLYSIYQHQPVPVSGPQRNGVV
jgi:hypothetical protein